MAEKTVADIIEERDTARADLAALRTRIAALRDEMIAMAAGIVVRPSSDPRDREYHAGTVAWTNRWAERLDAVLAAPTNAPDALRCPRCGSADIGSTIERHTCRACGAFGWPTIGGFVAAPPADGELGAYRL